MATYFLEYLDNPKLNSSLSDIAETVSSEFIYSAGSWEKGGLFVKVKASDGQVIWTRHYQLEGNTINFKTVVQCDNGDFMLYGSHVIGANKNLNLVLRVDAEGHLIWSRTYTAQRTRFNYRLVKSVKDTYYMASWFNEKGSIDDLEIIKINGNGTVLASKLIGNSSDDQVSGMIPYKDGILLFGGTSEGPGWDNFLLLLDGNLKQVWGFLVGNKDYQHIQDIVPLGDNHFGVTGEETNAEVSFFFNFNPNQTSFDALTYDLMPGTTDIGWKRLIFSGKHYYLTAKASGQTWSSVTKLDTSFNIVWHNRLAHKDGYYLRDVQIHPKDTDRLRAVGALTTDGTHAFLMTSDLDFESCLTEKLQIPKGKSVNFKSSKWTPPITAFKVVETIIKVIELAPELATKHLCAPSPVRLGPAYFQSPYVYLQAAGSTGADDSVTGFHLRWAFQRSLGDKHLPKGDLSGPSGQFPSTLNFNKDNDFVNIYRAEFRDTYWTPVNFSNPPSVLLESGLVRRWTYNNIIPVGTLPTNVNSVEISFTNITQYDAIRSTINPLTNPIGFVQQYNGVMEARVVDKLCFKMRIGLGQIQSGPTGVGFIKMETVSLPDQLDPASAMLSSRQNMQNLSTNNLVQVTCENIHHFRFAYGGNVAPIRLMLLTYDDYLKGIDNQFPADWVLLGEYGLSLNDAKVHGRLEDSTRYSLHRHWRKFNEPSPSGEFRVNVLNYQNRWSMPEGLKEGVQEYLQLSQTDPTATAIIPNNDPMTNSSQMEVSYLDLLNIVSLDFHVARMLGLGEIDPPITGASQQTEYVFLMEYMTSASLEGEPPSLLQHLYMTPPITFMDYKLPPKPTLEPVRYGFNANNLTGNPTPITDPNGYLPFADARFINLDKAKFRYELPFESFFQTIDEFNLCKETIPLSFGVEYGAGGIGTGGFVRPELENDPNFQDPGGLNEVVPLAETGINPIYVHQETQVGVHHYALYSINWFSRVSPISNEVETDYTQFPLRCPLLPPLNLQAQLIQEEQPLIFTTGAEQAMLAGIGTSDKTLLRATFDWNYVHNTAYQFADKIQFYFRKDALTVVKGEIPNSLGAIVEDPILHLVTVQSSAYLITSTNPAQTVTPVIPFADKSKFIGGSLVANGVAFVIEDILTTAIGTNPSFVLKQIRETHNQESPANSNIWYTTETWVSPLPGERFFVYESLSHGSTWDQVLTKEVTVVNFMPTYTETTVHPDGNILVQQIGGLTDLAKISHRYDLSPGAPPFTPTGAYDVLFDTQNLTNHPDVDVDFYRGIMRVSALSGEKKELQVWAIDNSGATLKLTVYDPSFLADPIIPITPSFQTGISVNFHPSYRAYFKFDGGFNTANILPGFDEGTRLTFLDARASDTITGCASHLAPPAVIVAREIREPVAPGVPTGPLFATRPNFYGKATYTFDILIDHPYALIFYRANERRILDTLYKPATVALILDELVALASPDVDFFQDRWSDLVNMQLDGSNNFKEYVSGGWRFKQPDNPKYEIPHPDPTVHAKPFATGLTLNNNFTYFDTVTNSNVTLSMIDIVKDAIDGAFLPLTEIPAIYSQVHDDVFVPSGRPPLLRDTNGQLLVYPNNDPWPMTVRYEKNGAGTVLQNGDGGYGGGGNTKWVRFTDFTLDGEAQNFYFYFAAELSSTLKVSERSPVAGPIQLVNSGPAKAPKIKKVETILSSDDQGTGPAIRFELNQIVESENIKKLEIYRSYDPALALSPRTMSLAKTLNVGDPIVDDFDDLADPPFGEPLFYRIVAFREIVNEQGNVEFVPSQPSNLALTNIVDNFNPEAPLVVVSSDPPIGTPSELPNVLLSWPKTVHNGTYYVYKMNNTGTWLKIYAIDPSVHLNAGSMSVPLSATSLGLSSLFKEDDDLNPIYHRFRVDVENSSGLLNLKKKEVTV